MTDIWYYLNRLAKEQITSEIVIPDITDQIGIEQIISSVNSQCARRFFISQLNSKILVCPRISTYYRVIDEGLTIKTYPVYLELIEDLPLPSSYLISYVARIDLYALLEGQG